MNGPTRSKAFDLPASGGKGRSVADAWPDELDQFVDSEPLAWTGRSRPNAPVQSDEPAPSRDGAPAGPPQADVPSPSARQVHVGGPSTAEAGVPLWTEADPAAESQSTTPPPASAAETNPRLDAFSRRLSEELARKGEGATTPSVDGERSAEDAGAPSSPTGIVPAPARPSSAPSRALAPTTADAPSSTDSHPSTAALSPTAVTADEESHGIGADPTAAPVHAPPSAPSAPLALSAPEPPWRKAIAEAAEGNRAAKGLRPAFSMPRATPTLQGSRKARAAGPAGAMPPSAPAGPAAPIVPAAPPAPPETPEARLERELDDAIGALVTGMPPADAETSDGPVATPIDEPELAQSLAEEDEALEPDNYLDEAIEPGGDMGTVADSIGADPHTVGPLAADAHARHEDDERAGDDHADAPERGDDHQDEGPVSPVKPLAAAIGGVIGGKRPRTIPTFKFTRRAEPDGEPFPAAPADMDDPLATAYLAQDEADMGARQSPITSELESEDGFFEADAHRDRADDMFIDGDEDEADAAALPASLRRRGRAGTRPSARAVGIAAVVVGAGAIALLGVLGFNMFAGAGTPVAEPPVIRADAGDVKVRPNTPAISAEPDITTRAEVGESGTLVVPDDVRVAGVQRASPAAEEGIVSRPVRTVVVRPDGTLLPSDTDVSAGDAAVRERPATLPTHNADFATVDPVDSIAASSAPARSIVPDEPTSAAPALSNSTALDTAAATATATAPDRDISLASDPAPTEIDTSAPLATGTIAVPRRRPAPPPRRLASATNEASSAVVGSSAGANAPWAIQVSSQRSREEAERAYRGLQQRYSSILGGVEPIIVSADVPGRGRFYRVRVPASTQGEAARLCQRLKSAGGDCFIGRN